MEMHTEYFKYTILPLKNKLFRKAFSITQSIEEAEDVVQEVMMRLWDRRSEWSQIDNMEVYCMVLTKNAALDKLRRPGYHNDDITTSQTEILIADTRHAQEQLEKDEAEALVWKVIGSLPTQQQELVKLREVEGLSYREIAAELQLSEAQVKVMLFRARQKMKERYLKINKNDGY